MQPILTSLWRVTWIHRAGYQAPFYYVEAKTRRKAILAAKERSRLKDFPKTWYCKVNDEGPVEPKPAKEA